MKLPLGLYCAAIHAWDPGKDSHRRFTKRQKRHLRNQFLSAVKRKPDAKHWTATVPLWVRGKSYKAQLFIDTGADVNAIVTRFADKYFKEFIVDITPTQCSTPSGDITMTQAVMLSFALDDEMPVIKIPFFLIESLPADLLVGINGMQKLGLEYASGVPPPWNKNSERVQDLPSISVALEIAAKRTLVKQSPNTERVRLPNDIDRYQCNHLTNYDTVMSQSREFDASIHDPWNADYLSAKPSSIGAIYDINGDKIKQTNIDSAFIPASDNLEEYSKLYRIRRDRTNLVKRINDHEQRWLENESTAPFGLYATQLKHAFCTDQMEYNATLDALEKATATVVDIRKSERTNGLSTHIITSAPQGGVNTGMVSAIASTPSIRAETGALLSANPGARMTSETGAILDNPRHLEFETSALRTNIARTPSRYSKKNNSFVTSRRVARGAPSAFKITSIKPQRRIRFSKRDIKSTIRKLAADVMEVEMNRRDELNPNPRIEDIDMYGADVGLWMISDKATESVKSANKKFNRFMQSTVQPAQIGSSTRSLNKRFSRYMVNAARAQRLSKTIQKMLTPEMIGMDNDKFRKAQTQLANKPLKMPDFMWLKAVEVKYPIRFKGLFDAVKALVAEFHDIIAKLQSDRPDYKCDPFRIGLKSEERGKPIHAGKYPLPEKFAGPVNDRLKEMMGSGFMKESITRNYNGIPCTITFKKPKGNDTIGRMKIVFDLRAVNLKCDKVDYVMPTSTKINTWVAETIQKERERVLHKGGIIFATFLDSKNCFEGFRLHPDDMKYVVSAVQVGNNMEITCEHQFAGYGHKNIAAHCQKFKDEIMLNFNRLMCYIDDKMIIFGACDTAEFIEIHRTLFQELREKGEMLNPEKLFIGVSGGEFVGNYHQISDNAHHTPTPAFVKKCMNFAMPKKSDDLRSFVQSVQYIAHYIHRFAEYASPLQDMLNSIPKDQRNGGSVQLTWSDTAKKNFERLQKRIGKLQLLYYPTGDGKFAIQCDASNQAAGAVLYQLQMDDTTHKMEWKIIDFFSKMWDKAHQGWHVSKLEALAIFLAIKYWKHHLITKHFLINTDHSNLYNIFSSIAKQDKDYFFARLRIALAPYSFSIFPIAGVKIPLPDQLSRGRITPQLVPVMPTNLKRMNPTRGTVYKFTNSPLAINDDPRQINSLLFDSVGAPIVWTQDRIASFENEMQDVQKRIRAKDVNAARYGVFALKSHRHERPAIGNNERIELETEISIRRLIDDNLFDYSSPIHWFQKTVRVSKAQSQMLNSIVPQATMLFDKPKRQSEYLNKLLDLQHIQCLYALKHGKDAIQLPKLGDIVSTKNLQQSINTSIENPSRMCNPVTRSTTKKKNENRRLTKAQHLGLTENELKQETDKDQIYDDILDTDSLARETFRTILGSQFKTSKINEQTFAAKQTFDEIGEKIFNFTLPGNGDTNTSDWKWMQEYHPTIANGVVNKTIRVKTIANEKRLIYKLPSLADKAKDIKERIYVPSSLICRLLKYAHSSVTRGMHSRPTTMFKFLNRYWFWPQMMKDINDLYAACPGCQASDGSPNKHGLIKSLPQYKVFECVMIDFLGPCFGRQGFISCTIDARSGLTQLQWSAGETSTDAMNALFYHWIPTHGKFDHLMCDRGNAFIDSTHRKLQEIIGTNMHFAEARHHHLIGKVENVVGLVRDHLRRWSVNLGGVFRDQLDTHLRRIGVESIKLALPWIQFAINNRILSYSSVSPNMIAYGRQLRGFDSIDKLIDDLEKFKVDPKKKNRKSDEAYVKEYLIHLEGLRRIYQRDWSKYIKIALKSRNKGRIFDKTPRFAVGDQVRLYVGNRQMRSRKMMINYKGPFTIVSVRDHGNGEPVSYELDFNSRGVAANAHVSHLEPYIKNERFFTEAEYDRFTNFLNIDVNDEFDEEYDALDEQDRLFVDKPSMVEEIVDRIDEDYDPSEDESNSDSDL